MRCWHRWRGRHKHFSEGKDGPFTLVCQQCCDKEMNADMQRALQEFCICSAHRKHEDCVSSCPCK